MTTRIFRALVCLVLVAALLVQVSPIRARAAGPNFFFVDPELQLASDLIGLGISVGTDAAAHNQVIQDAADWLADTGEWLSEGMLKVYKVAAAAGGYKYMVDGDFLQELFEWMFDAEVVTVQSDIASLLVPLAAGSSLEGSAIVVNTDCQIFHYYYSTTLYTCCISTEKIVYTSLGQTHTSSSYVNNDLLGGSIVYYADFSGLVSADSVSYMDTNQYSGTTKNNRVNVCLNGLAPIVNASISTDKDLSLNHVGAFGSILPDSYPDWFANSTTITDSETGEEKTVVPVALGQTLEETQSMTQADVWAGASTYVETETDVGTGDDTVTVPETVTLKDILTGILSVPKSIAQAVAAFFADVVAAVKAIPAAITEFFTISADVSAFAIEWRDFFPFCIPFDIYDFLTLLMAEPEAPKFEWEIDLLKTGEPYLMVVDLSEWDDVAQLLRRLELLVFIVGLAMVTREKYIRG